MVFSRMQGEGKDWGIGTYNWQLVAWSHNENKDKASAPIEV